jgi:hypothetical protein
VNGSYRNDLHWGVLLLKLDMVNLGDVFKWHGVLTAVQWINEGNRSIGFVTKDTAVCKHCGAPLDETWNVIESSPQWKEAEPVETIDKKE